MPAPEVPAERELLDRLVAVANGADDAELDLILAPGFERVGDPLSESAVGIPAYRALLRKMRLDMPDLQIRVLDVVIDGGRAALHWELSGTDSGPGDFAPTGRRATVAGMSFFGFEGGRIAREATILDGVALLSQLGFRLEPPANGPIRPDSGTG